jgi:hypothetical protein
MRHRTNWQEVSFLNPAAPFVRSTILRTIWQIIYVRKLQGVWIQQRA